MQRYINQFYLEFIPELEQVFGYNSSLSIIDASYYALKNGGKRVRPFLLYLCYNLYIDQTFKHSKNYINGALAIECFHNFTLVHDDIMDSAELRRNQQSVYKKYGINTAILTGDLMLIKCYELLNQYPNDISTELIQVFGKTATEICIGQQMDSDFEDLTEVSIESYLNMIEYKTAVLLGCACFLGAKIANASSEDASHLYQFGKYLGIAFQMQDDYLDIYGDPVKTGKIIGGDIIQHKKNYFYVKAIELLKNEKDPKHRFDFIRLYHNNDKAESVKIEEVKKIYDELFLSNYCIEAKSAYYDLALSHLNALKRDSEIVEILNKLAKIYTYREN